METVSRRFEDTSLAPRKAAVLRTLVVAASFSAAR